MDVSEGWRVSRTLFYSFRLPAADELPQGSAVHMITRLFSAALRGVEAQEVEVEVNARGADKPVIIVVGLLAGVPSGCRF